MIITALQGGLGNQMFQYAIGMALSIKNKTELKLDTSTLPKGVPPRTYELDIFGINGPIAKDKEIKKLAPPRNFLTARSPRLTRWINLRTRSYINEQLLEKRLPVIFGDVYLDGYWQSEDYFKDYVKEIRKCFTFKKKPTKYALLWIDKINKNNSVSVHVRRTDYVKRKGRAPIVGCSLRYYHQAMSILAGKIKRPVFYIFSDDTAWSKKHLSFPEFTVYFPSSENKADHNIDMFLMSQCSHNIVANSSFSWWGAWLNPNPKKIVVAPDPWFNTPETWRREIILPPWMRIPKTQ